MIVNRRLLGPAVMLVMIALLMLFGIAPERAQGDDEDGCTTASLAGRWGFSSSGVVVTGSFAGPTAAAGVFTAAPDGGFSGAATASFNGAVFPAVTFAGNFTVNPDCTGSAALTNSLGLKETFDFVAVDKKRELRAIQTSSDLGPIVISLSAKTQ